AIYADGRLIYAPQISPKWRPFQPTWIEVASPFVQAPHQILIHLETHAKDAAGLSSFWIGAKSALEPRYELRQAVQITAAEWGNVIFLVIGAIPLVIWFQRRDEPAYLLIFALAVCISVHALEYFIGDDPLPVSDDLFQWLISTSGLWYTSLLFAVVSYYI